MSVPRRRRRRWGRRIRAVDAENAIYIDFEGTMDEPACFVGVLDQLDPGGWKLRQFAFDPCLKMAASGPASIVQPVEPAWFVEWLRGRSEEHRAKVVSWSEHDIDVLYRLDPELAIRFRNARVSARRWSRDNGLELGGDLQSYLNQIGFVRPAEIQSGAAGWIRYIWERCEGKSSWDEVSAGARQRWRWLQEHNATDLEGMRAVVEATFSSH